MNSCCVGSALKVARTKAGVTRKFVSEDLGITSNSNLKSVENCIHGVSIGLLCKLIKCYRLSFAEFGSIVDSIADSD